MSAIFATDGEARRYEKLTSITSSTGFTAANVEYKGKIASAVLMTVEIASVRFTLDGTTPTTTATTSVGHMIDPGQSYVVRGGSSMRNFRCINEVAGSSAVVHCTYFFTV